MRDFGQCERTRSGRKIACRQKRRRFVLLNANQVPVRVVQIDGCVLTDGLACDHLFIPAFPRMEIYVELKGSAVGHGIKQIEATIPRVSEDARKLAKHCYIVSRCVPPKLLTRIQRAKVRFRRDYNAGLTVKNKVAEHKLATA